MSAIRIIVGLANPGKAYAATRHNAGAWFVEDLIKQTACTPLKFETKFHGYHTTFLSQNTRCHLLIPTTFMNESGKAVRALMHYCKLSAENLLVAHDDIDLPVGTIKLKFDGGDGGHNGLKDVIKHIHTKAFHRLRIGVGRPRQTRDVIDYVLHAPSKVDRQKIDTALTAAYDILPLLISGETQKAMQQLHTSD